MRLLRVTLKYAVDKKTPFLIYGHFLSIDRCSWLLLQDHNPLLCADTLWIRIFSDRSILWPTKKEYSGIDKKIECHISHAT